MRVSTFIILLIFACCGCGLFLFTGLDQIHTGESKAKADVAQRKLALRDMSLLEASFDQWLVLSDLVFGNDQTYLLDGAVDLASRLATQKKTLDKELVFLSKDRLNDFDVFLKTQSRRLNESAALNQNDRERRLYEMLTEMDNESVKPIESLATLREEIEREYKSSAILLDKIMATARSKKICLLCLFLFSIFMLWAVSSRKLGRPITQLTSDSKLVMTEGCEFSSLANAPIELTELRSSFVELVKSLKDKIREINQKQIEREQLHKEMMEVSRQAGMAEVASEVLHNVGNVLNSLNVSVAVTRDQLSKSTIDKLVIARDVIKENEDDLAEFLTTTKRGQNFSGALDVVTDRLVSEHQKCVMESEVLLGNINHVRAIINAQQSLARGTGGVIQEFCLEETIQSCVGIMSESLVRHHVEIELECPRLMNLKTDKDKLKQVLVNLISNARDAIVEQGQGEQDRRITIRVTEIEGSVQISVRDTGVGIAKENLKQLFTHGFTTKQTGHGFGLHSGALAAQAMGGALSAQSNGKGAGATFVLVIPKEQSQLCKV